LSRRILFRGEAGDGVIEVVQEASGVRTLHFGTASKQTALHPETPHQLILPYTRALTAALLFNPEPRRILLIGLGGGALAHFFRHHFPEAVIDAVERCPQVVAVAREFFALPEGDPRLRIHLAEAQAFLETDIGQGLSWDLVLTDAYDAGGPADATLDRGFYRALGARLETNGVLAANLWSGRRNRVKRTLRGLEASYGRPVYVLRPRGKANMAALAGRGAMPGPDAEELRQRAKVLETRVGLDYPGYLEGLRPASGRLAPGLG